MEVIRATKAGTCYGVQRALDIAEEVLDTCPCAYTLGPLIHNPVVVGELASLGVEQVRVPEEAPAQSVLVMRAHGVTPEIEVRALEAGLTVVDATCPFVKRVHEIAQRLAHEGYQVVIVGEAGHAEVEGTLGHAPEASVVGSAEEVELLSLGRRMPSR